MNFCDFRVTLIIQFLIFHFRIEAGARLDTLPRVHDPIAVQVGRDVTVTEYLCLRVAHLQLCHEVIQSHALCFRMGGDEFAAISDSQDEKGLLACLEDATARLSCLADGMGLGAPTLGVGFSSVQTDGTKTYEVLLKYADKHLYQEKGEKKGAR